MSRYKYIAYACENDCEYDRIISYDTESELEEKKKMEPTNKEIRDFKIWKDQSKLNYLFLDIAESIQKEINSSENIDMMDDDIFDPMEKRINEEDTKIIVTFRKGNIVRFKKEKILNDSKA